TADPSFLHPDFGNTTALQFLNSFPEKKLVFSTSNFSNPSLGSGWSWDDYNDDYQAEISPLPMYGNIVRFQIKDTTGVSLNPSLFQNSFFQSNQGQFIQRELEDNQFAVPSEILTKEKYLQDIPFKTSPSLTQQFLMDTLQRFVHLDNLPLPDSAATLYTIPLDTLYKRMMQISDNMVAEHLLLLCASPHNLPIQTAQVISFIQEKYLTDLPDKPKWVDGSGLSRYNLMTPRSITTLLDKMWRSYPQEKLFSYLAAGGGIGTLGSLYASSKKPYIFAKSGSMSGVYNQSGYLVTQSGKILIFSAMNNNFTLPIKTVRQEVGKLMDWIYTQIP
ncbi:MAG: D-alanyl-D-alanine carboxypeptidase, partial [Spirosomataceae bacterium]